jgi:hypothetical protein
MIADIKASLRPVVGFAVAPLLPTMLFIQVTGQVFPQFVVAVGYALAFGIGIPAYCVMRWRGFTRLKHFLVIAFFAFGLAVFGWSITSYMNMGSLMIGGVQLVESGSVTVAGWLRCISYGIQVGLYATLGGGIFWAIVHSALLTAERSTVGWLFLIVLTVAAGLTHRSINWSGATAEDLGCHSPQWPDLSVKVWIDLQIEIADWPRLTRQLSDLARVFDLSFRDASQSTPGVVQTHYVSLCDDVGLHIRTAEQRWAIRDYQPPISNRGVGVSIRATNTHETWPIVADRLLDIFESEWDDRVRFLDGLGEPVPRPEFVMPLDQPVQ